MTETELDLLTSIRDELRHLRRTLAAAAVFANRPYVSDTGMLRAGEVLYTAMKGDE